MALVGVLARVDRDQRQAVWKDLESDAGLTPFRIEDENRMGILIEAPTLDGAHVILKERINPVPGVLGTWPVYMYSDPVEDCDSTEAPATESQGE